MTNEQENRAVVLMEDMDRKLGAVTESVQSVAAMLAEVKDDFIRRFDHIDAEFVGMKIEMRDLKAEVGTLGSKVDRLEVFASDAGPRLVRIETHLALPALPPRQDKAKLAPSKTPHRRKPLKRN
jgi:hypothetical protein